MPNFVYTIAKDRLMRGSLDLLGQPVYLSTLSPISRPDPDAGDDILLTVVGSPVELLNKYVFEGTFSADSVEVKDIQRDQVVKAFLIHSATTPIAYLGGSGLPFTGNGGIVTLSWKQQDNVIFKL